MNFPNFLMTLLTTLLSLTVLGIGVSWYFARYFCKPKRKLPKKSPESAGLKFEDISFMSHGVTLNGWFIPGKRSEFPRPTIVVAHGWSANAAQVLPIARFLNAAGYHVLLYNARSHGTSGEGGPITLQKFSEDLIAAISYLEGRRDVDMDQLGVVGHSMGGSGSIVAASMDSRIRALVGSAAFADPVALTKEYMAKHRIPRWPLFHLVSFFINRWLDTSMAEIAPKNRIGRIQVPTLLIHGDADEVISPENMEILQACSKNGVVETFLMSGGKHHSTIIRDPEFGPRIVEFFEQHLRLEENHAIPEEELMELQPV
jgi:dipeptidyl aminopeptidase/acylaminoacyl peptidase